MTQGSVSAGSVPAMTGSPHPGRMTVGQHLPYTGREVNIFSRYGYFYPPGYLPNTTVGGFRGLAQALTTQKFGMRANYFKIVGVGAAKFAGCFLLFYLPLDTLYCDLRKKQRERRAKQRGE